VPDRIRGSLGLARRDGAEGNVPGTRGSAVPVSKRKWPKCRATWDRKTESVPHCTHRCHRAVRHYGPCECRCGARNLTRADETEVSRDVVR
jgi:hypothetical protein